MTKPEFVALCEKYRVCPIFFDGIWKSLNMNNHHPETMTEEDLYQFLVEADSRGNISLFMAATVKVSPSMRIS